MSILTTKGLTHSRHMGFMKLKNDKVDDLSNLKNATFVVCHA